MNTAAAAANVPMISATAAAVIRWPAPNIVADSGAAIAAITAATIGSRSHHGARISFSTANSIAARNTLPQSADTVDISGKVEI